MVHSQPPPPPPPPPTPPNIQPQSFSLESKINPSILLIIIILSIIFFISGLLHLLIRLLLRPTTQQSREDEDELYRDHASVLQGQLQQLFHLHDSGVDQSYIDTLPVFMYKSIIGLKDPFDCAVCLCEFEMDDCLRLLPKCSHAFHMDCIDTWLLSHSTCPLCRSSLLSEHRNVPNISSPFLCVLESASGEDSAREIGGERYSVSGSLGNEAEFGSGRVGFPRKSCDGKITRSEIGSGRVGLPRKTCDGKITGNEFGSGRVGLSKKSCDVNEKNEEKIVFVKLGKFMNVDVGEGSNNNEHNVINNNNNNNNNNIISGGKDDLGSRRCYSMGSFAYVLDEATSLQVVPIKNTTQMKKKTSSSKKPRVPLKLGHRATMSEYGFDSQREFNGIEALKTIDNPRIIEGCQNNNGYVNGIERMSNRRESFSISKIWGRGNNKRLGNDHHESSRRTNNSEFEIEVNELGVDRDETLSCYSGDSLVNPTTNYNSSSTRRTLLWLMGRTNNKIVHNHSTSFSSNV